MRLTNLPLLFFLSVLPLCAQNGSCPEPDAAVRAPMAERPISPSIALPSPLFPPSAPLPAPAEERRIVGGYVNRLTAATSARKAQGGIIIVGSGPALRAFSSFSATHESAATYAAIANKYKDVFGPGVRVYCMPIPLPVAYYCPDDALGWTGSCANTLNNVFSQLSDSVVAVDVYTTLGEHAAEPIYLRTDHHWAPLGAYYAARRFAELAGVPFPDLSHYDTLVVHDFVGTMAKYSKDPAVRQAPEDFIYHVPRNIAYTTTYISYSLDRSRKHVTAESELAEGSFFKSYKDGSAAAYCTFMGGDTKLTHVHTSAKTGRRLLILKDSFGNALPGYLFFSFDDIHVVDCRYFTQNIVDYARRHQVTDILFANNLSHACSTASTDAYERYLQQ